MHDSMIAAWQIAILTAMTPIKLRSLSCPLKRFCKSRRFFSTGKALRQHLLASHKDKALSNKPRTVRVRFARDLPDQGRPPIQNSFSSDDYYPDDLDFGPANIAEADAIIAPSDQPVSDSDQVKIHAAPKAVENLKELREGTA